MKIVGLSGLGKCMTLGDRCSVSSNSPLPPDIEIVTFTAFNCSYMCWPLTHTQLPCAIVSHYFFAQKHQPAFIYFWNKCNIMNKWSNLKFHCAAIVCTVHCALYNVHAMVVKVAGGLFTLTGNLHSGQILGEF